MHFIRQMGKPGGINHITCRIATSFFDIRYIKKPVAAPANDAANAASDEEEERDKITITCEKCPDVEELSRFLKSRLAEYEAALTSEASVNFPLSKVLAGKIVSIVDILRDEPLPTYYMYNSQISVLTTMDRGRDQSMLGGGCIRHFTLQHFWHDMELVAAAKVLHLTDPSSTEIKGLLDGLIKYHRAVRYNEDSLPGVLFNTMYSLNWDNYASLMKYVEMNI